jgi:hypothetical protein
LIVEPAAIRDASVRAATFRRQRWIIYALGGGHGHLVRAAALARATRRLAAPPDLTILSNSRAAAARWARDEFADDELISLAAGEPKSATAARVREHLTAPYDALVVDTFPRGLAGELLDVITSHKAQQTLIHRDVSPRYVKACDLDQLVQHFDLLLAPGELGPLFPRRTAIRERWLLTNPWLIRDEDELLSRDEARAAFGITESDGPLVVVLGAGKEPEIREREGLYRRLRSRLAGRAAVRWIASSPHNSGEPQLSLWPFFQYIRGADLIVGAGGYNTVYESRAAGVDLLAAVQTRLYDRQEHRLHPSETVADDFELMRRVDEWADNYSAAPADKSFENGAHVAARAIFASVAVKTTAPIRGCHGD